MDSSHSPSSIPSPSILISSTWAGSLTVQYTFSLYSHPRGQRSLTVQYTFSLYSHPRGQRSLTVQYTFSLYSHPRGQGHLPSSIPSPSILIHVGRVTYRPVYLLPLFSSTWAGSLTVQYTFSLYSHLIHVDTVTCRPVYFPPLFSSHPRGQRSLAVQYTFSLYSHFIHMDTVTYCPVYLLPLFSSHPRGQRSLAVQYTLSLYSHFIHMDTVTYCPVYLLPLFSSHPRGQRSLAVQYTLSLYSHFIHMDTVTYCPVYLLPLFSSHPRGQRSLAVQYTLSLYSHFIHMDSSHLLSSIPSPSILITSMWAAVAYRPVYLLPLFSSHLCGQRSLTVQYTFSLYSHHIYVGSGHLPSSIPSPSILISSTWAAVTYHPVYLLSLFSSHLCGQRSLTVQYTFSLYSHLIHVGRVTYRPVYLLPLFSSTWAAVTYCPVYLLPLFSSTWAAVTYRPVYLLPLFSSTWAGSLTVQYTFSLYSHPRGQRSLTVQYTFSLYSHPRGQRSLTVQYTFSLYSHLIHVGSGHLPSSIPSPSILISSTWAAVTYRPVYLLPLFSSHPRGQRSLTVQYTFSLYSHLIHVDSGHLPSSIPSPSILISSTWTAVAYRPVYLLPLFSSHLCGQRSLTVQYTFSLYSHLDTSTWAAVTYRPVYLLPLFSSGHIHVGSGQYPSGGRHPYILGCLGSYSVGSPAGLYQIQS